MRKRNPLLRLPDHRVGGLRAPSQTRPRNLVSIRTPAGAGASVQGCRGRLGVGVRRGGRCWAGGGRAGAGHCRRGHQLGDRPGSNTVPPIVVATSTPGSPIPVGIGPFGIAITPAPWAVPAPTPIPTQRPVGDPDSDATYADTDTHTQGEGHDDHALGNPVPSSLRVGGFAIPIANVAPFNSTGTVQFKDGNTNIGGRCRWPTASP